MRAFQYTIDDDGNEVPEHSTVRWVEWFAEHRRQGKHVVHREEVEHLGERIVVSSIFLGTDMATWGPPLIYETMVFGGKLHGCRVRWTSRQMALFGAGYIAGLVTSDKHPSVCRHQIGLMLIRGDAFSEGEPDSIQRAMHGIEREAR